MNKNKNKELKVSRLRDCLVFIVLTNRGQLFYTFFCPLFLGTKINKNLDDKHLYAILEAVTLEVASKYKTTFVKKAHSDALKHALEAMGEK